MMQQFFLAFAAGVTVGPACLLHCGLFHGAFLARHAQADRRRQAVLGLALLGGRLAAYLMFGLLLGLVISSGILVVQRWVLTLALGVLMLAYAVLPRRERAGCACGTAGTGVFRGAVALGFVTGLSPCPPLLASGAIALQSHGVGAAVLTLVAFFAGSSVCLVPVWFGLAALSAGVRQRLRTASRVLAGLVAAYAFGTLSLAWVRSPHPPGVGDTIAAAPGPARPSGDGSADPAAMPLASADSDRVISAGSAAVASAALPPPAGPEIKPLFVKQPPTRRFTASLVQSLQLSLKEAKHWVALEDGAVQCQLCPARCLLDNGQQGMCRARVNIDGKLRSMTYGCPVSVRVDPVEKKPLYHVLPGSKTFSLATVGCNLGCVFCQNFEISQAAPEDVPHHNLPPAKVIELAQQPKYRSEGIAYTYTEPTVFFEYMFDIGVLAREKGLKNYWITCGFIEEAPLLELCTILDAANVDLKGFSDEFYVKYCNARLEPVLRTLRILKREKVQIEITNLIVPEGNDDPAMIRDMCAWIVQELGPDTPLHFSRFHPAYKLTKRQPTPIGSLMRARDIARAAGLRYVYVGNVPGEGLSDTICPSCGKTLLQRAGYLVVANHVKDGGCQFCGAPVAGVWK